MPLRRIFHHSHTCEPTCPICHEPVKLERAKADEEGKPVHEECYARKMASLPEARPRQNRWVNGGRERAG